MTSPASERPPPPFSRPPVASRVTHPSPTTTPPTMVTRPLVLDHLPPAAQCPKAARRRCGFRLCRWRRLRRQRRPRHEIRSNGIPVHVAAITDPLPMPRFVDNTRMIPAEAASVGGQPPIARGSPRETAVLVGKINSFTPAVVAVARSCRVFTQVDATPVLPPILLVRQVTVALPWSQHDAILKRSPDHRHKAAGRWPVQLTTRVIGVQHLHRQSTILRPQNGRGPIQRIDRGNRARRLRPGITSAQSDQAKPANRGS